MQRGKIHNHNRARQQRDYSNLRYGNITPTDIDGLIEYHDEAYIIWELKYVYETLSWGQRTALERLTDDLQMIKPTLCVIAVHDMMDPEIDIVADKAVVSEFRRNRMWRKTRQNHTLKEIIDVFIESIDGEFTAWEDSF